jgi:membrane protein
VHALIRKFLADRGTHLAAMIAYFAILAFVPLLFLSLSLLTFAGEQDESSYLIKELERAFPESSVSNLLDVVTEIQEQAKELSVIGGIGLIWAALGFFSVLESAFNIVYGLPNRPFIRQKSFVLLLTAGFLIVLFVALVIGSVGVELVQRAGVAEGAVSYVYVLFFSTALLVGFTWSLYRLLTNTILTWRETLPGALVAAVFLQASFQILPIFVRLSRELIALQAYGGLVLLLVWLYLMANILVFGAEVNWWLGPGRRGAAVTPPVAAASEPPSP